MRGLINGIGGEVRECPATRKTDLTGWIYYVGATILGAWAGLNEVPMVPAIGLILVVGAIFIRLGMILEK